MTHGVVLCKPKGSHHTDVERVIVLLRPVTDSGAPVLAQDLKVVSRDIAESVRLIPIINTDVGSTGSPVGYEPSACQSSVLG
jgi:hypothetical protein